jgi:hypothetical protein
MGVQASSAARCASVDVWRGRASEPLLGGVQLALAGAEQFFGCGRLLSGGVELCGELFGVCGGGLEAAGRVVGVTMGLELG